MTGALETGYHTTLPKPRRPVKGRLICSQSEWSATPPGARTARSRGQATRLAEPTLTPPSVPAGRLMKSNARPGVAVCTALLLLCGMMMYELLRSMWSFEQPNAVSSGLMNTLLSWVGL